MRKNIRDLKNINYLVFLITGIIIPCQKAKQLNIMFIETSAKENRNINEVSTYLNFAFETKF